MTVKTVGWVNPKSFELGGYTSLQHYVKSGIMDSWSSFDVDLVENVMGVDVVACDDVAQLVANGDDELVDVVM